MLARIIADTYRQTRPKRRQVVVENLVPVVGGEYQQARKTASKLFQQFALKLVDLWRYENGYPVDKLFHELIGWEHFLSAQARNRGVLFLTIHLGNWELGAPILTQRGIALQVVSLAEPQPKLTRLRQSARARWGIKTLTLGEDPFASLELIRCLEANHGVALLIDRPPAETAVSVDFFGRPFLASIAAAELARASGCALLPVCIPRTTQGYVAHILPEIFYDRRTLRDQAARIRLTQEIIRAFEPVVYRFPEQWYHFVPVWPASPKEAIRDPSAL